MNLAQRNMRYIAVIFAIFTLSGCAHRLERHEVVGEYESPWRSGTERLVLNLDGTFDQKFVASDSVITNSGVWTWYQPGPAQIEMWGFMRPDDWLSARLEEVIRKSMFGLEALELDDTIILNYGNMNGTVYRRTK